MRCKKCGEFSDRRLETLIDVLKAAPADYIMYAACVDSIYPITGVLAGIVDDEAVSFSSIETYGENPPKTCRVDEMTKNLVCGMEHENAYNWDVCLEAATNVDPDLDMQLTENRTISSWGIDDICKMFVLFAGEPWDEI